MKIAIFSDTIFPQINGVSKNLDKLIEYFSDNNIEFILFAPEVEGDYDSKYESKIIRMSSIDFFLYPELKFSLPNYIKIKTELRNFQPDLIHLVTPFNIGLAGRHYAKRHKIPYAAAYLTNFDQYLNYYNINFLNGVSWKFMKWFHKDADCNYCPSRDTLEQLKKKGIKNLNIWGRGIDTKLFSPDYRDNNLRKKYNLHDKTIFLYVGRLAKEKNITLLIDSFKKLSRKYKDEIALLITGDGPEIDFLKNKSSDNIIFTGPKTGEELSKIYASADIFAFPSVTETYGNVVIEAMSSALPVVAVMAGGVKENLIDGFNGLAAKNQADDFTLKLEKLLNNDLLRNKLSKNAREHAMKQTWDNVFNNLMNSFQEVLDQSYRDARIEKNNMRQEKGRYIS